MQQENLKVLKHCNAVIFYLYITLEKEKKNALKLIDVITILCQRRLRICGQ
jgi:hypothetical protein